MNHCKKDGITIFKYETLKKINPRSKMEKLFCTPEQNNIVYIIMQWELSNDQTENLKNINS